MITRGNTFETDENGDEILLSSDGGQVMMKWEKIYMEKCVDALKIAKTSDEVLEIGFGCGFSADRIQLYQPKSHTIVECDQLVLEKLTKWAKNKPNVRIISGIWQDVLYSLPEFDCIFFDDYPLPEVQKIHTTVSTSRWHDFLDVALNWNLRVGGRITGYLAREIDLQRDYCSVEIEPMMVEVSKCCNYFPNSKAFIPVITLQHQKSDLPVQRKLSREEYKRHFQQDSNANIDTKRKYSVMLDKNKEKYHPKILQIHEKFRMQKELSNIEEHDDSHSDCLFERLNKNKITRREYIKLLKKRKQISKK